MGDTAQPCPDRLQHGVTSRIAVAGEEDQARIRKLFDLVHPGFLRRERQQDPAIMRQQACHVLIIKRPDMLCRMNARFGA